MITTFYFLFVFLSVVISASLTIYAWTWRNQFVGRLFFLTTLSGTWLVVCNFAILVSPTEDSAYIFARLQNLGTGMTAANGLLFILAYTGRIHRLRAIYVIPLYISAIVNFIIIWTDPLHGWFYKSFDIIHLNNFTFVQVVFNWWFFVHSTYFTIIILVCNMILIVSMRGAHGIIRRQYIGILIAISLPATSAIGSILLRNLGVKWVTSYNPYPISFTLFNLILARILLYDHFLDITPIAHPLILSEIPESIIITDQHGRIVELNSTARAMKNLKEGEKVGESVYSVFTELQSLVSGDVISPPHADSSSAMYLEYHAKPLYRKAQFIGTLIMLRDITRQKQFQQRELELALEKERVHILTKFIEKVSHEVRTPLSIIRNSAYLITRVDDVDKRAGNVDQIQAQIYRINRLVEMMLKITHLESTPPSFKPMTITLLLETILGEWRSKPNMPKIHYAPPKSLPIILGDENFLYDAINELLDNARRFSPPDGEITLWASANTTYVIVTIEDNGIGIEADKIPHIFEMFWRNDLATNTGLGLGLPFVRQIAHLHKGDIQVKSEVGKGSRFSLLLPIA